MAILDADKEGFLRSETSSDPDDWTCGKKFRGSCDHVCRYDHRFHAKGNWMRPSVDASIQIEV